jgi:hypothetical protein
MSACQVSFSSAVEVSGLQREVMTGRVAAWEHPLRSEGGVVFADE